MINTNTDIAKKTKFPLKTIYACITLLFVIYTGFISSIFHYRILPKYKQQNEVFEQHYKERQEAYHKRVNHDFLIYNLKAEYYRLQPKDENRFFDCRWKSHDVIPQPFYAFPYLNYFTEKNDDKTFTGLSFINGWTSLIYVSNLENYNHKTSKVFFQIRGSDYGLHKSNLPIETLSLIKRSEKYKDALMFIPDNFVFIDGDGKDLTRDRMQSVCHNRTYDGGRYISNEWYFFDKGAFWDKYDKLFINEEYKNNEHIIIFAYSNGSSPRNQLMRTYQTKECVNDSMEEFEKCHEFVDKRAFRIKSIIDLETNYDYHNLKQTTMFVNRNIRGFEDRYYYAICASISCPVANHERLISLLKLKPKPMKPGFVRYQDDTGRIIIDMIDSNGPIQISHSGIIPFGIEQFEEMSKK